jgi:hypothetical protein
MTMGFGEYNCISHHYHSMNSDVTHGQEKALHGKAGVPLGVEHWNVG